MAEWLAIVIGGAICLYLLAVAFAIVATVVWLFRN